MPSLITVEIRSFARVITRQEINFLANSASPFKWTKDYFSVLFRGL